MIEPVPSLSTDQIAAFVELAKQGSIRQAAEVLGISEQGLRNRILALEQRLRVELYRKGRGRRRATPLTEQGHFFLPQAAAFLERARDLCGLLGEEGPGLDVHVAASQYLILYVLIDAIRSFRKDYPGIHVRVSTLSESDVEEAVLRKPDIAFGVAAPYEPSPELVYTKLFELEWSFVVPPEHPLLRRRSIRLEHLVDQPLILFERGSTGRQHIIDSFHDAGLSPTIAMETTNTEIIVRMVEAGMGVSILPLLKSGTVTQGRRVAVRPLGKQIRPIHSGILRRRGEVLSGGSSRFLEFVMGHGGPKRGRIG
jgi:DNA-binding transcriptional LysR family regulator